MNVSPCRGCENELRDKKHFPACRVCKLPGQYSADIGGLAFPVPIRLLDITSKYNLKGESIMEEKEIGSSPKKRLNVKKWENQDQEFLVENFSSMTNKELSEKLNRTQGAIWTRLNILGLRRSEFKKGLKVKTNNKMALPEIKDNEIPPSPVRNSTMLKSDNDYFVIDFTEYPDLRQSIINAAKNNFRTPQNQMLFLIDEALKLQAT